jgi:acyl carrier protein
MTRDEFLAELEKTLDLPAQTLRGDEPLDQVDGWDSLAAISVLSMLDEQLGVSVEAGQLANCRSVPDLVALAGERVTDA